MVDLFGGSLINAASRIAITSGYIHIVAGANLPMLLEVFASRDFSSLDEVVLTDDRLIHGQVATVWSKESNRNYIR